jgi:hypothetical protein
MEFLGEEFSDETLYIAFAKFETRCKEVGHGARRARTQCGCCRQFDRARVIYKYALDHVPKAHAQQLYQARLPAVLLSLLIPPRPICSLVSAPRGPPLCAGRCMRTLRSSLASVRALRT